MPTVGLEANNASSAITVKLRCRVLRVQRELYGWRYRPQFSSIFISTCCVLVQAGCPKKLMCGNNGVTYKNKCQLNDAQYEDTEIEIQYDGACVEYPDPDPVIIDPQEVLQTKFQKIILLQRILG